MSSPFPSGRIEREPLPPSQRVALRINVDTFRGTVEGVPRLVDALRRHEANATFLFSLGPDHTGRAIRRALRPGFPHTIGRTSVLEHYGLKTLLYGTLLPAPDIGTRCAQILRGVRDMGFEVGIHTWDHVKWQDNVITADAEWTVRQMQLATERFAAIFEAPARVHGAAGWQMNIHAYRLTQRLGFDYCSDTRGTHPFIPVYNAELIACPQIPTTLPTFDELIGRDGIEAADVAARLLALAEATETPAGHVFTLHAELEGMKLLPAFEQLLGGWKNRGIEFLSLGMYLEAAGTRTLPRHRLERGSVAGRGGSLAVQGPQFLP